MIVINFRSQLYRTKGPLVHAVLYYFYNPATLPLYHKHFKQSLKEFLHHHPDTNSNSTKNCPSKFTVHLPLSHSFPKQSERVRGLQALYTQNSQGNAILVENKCKKHLPNTLPPTLNAAKHLSAPQPVFYHATGGTAFLSSQRQCVPLLPIHFIGDTMNFYTSHFVHPPRSDRSRGKIVRRGSGDPCRGTRSIAYTQRLSA